MSSQTRSLSHLGGDQLGGMDKLNYWISGQLHLSDKNSPAAEVRLPWGVKERKANISFPRGWESNWKRKMSEMHTTHLVTKTGVQSKCKTTGFTFSPQKKADSTEGKQGYPP